MFKKFTLSLFCLGLFQVTLLFAQTTEFQRCSTMEVYEERLAENPDLEDLDHFEEWLQKGIAKKLELQESGSQKAGTIYTIPTICHIIHNGEAVGTGSNLSYAQIVSQIDVLNEDFRKIAGTPGFNSDPVGADSEIEFCLAEFDESGNALAEPGVNRVNRNTAGFSAPTYGTAYIDNTIKPSTVWDPNSYMNMWVMSLGGGLLGYAQFPESSLAGMGTGAQSGATDGVVVLNTAFGRVGNVNDPFDEGRTATHEVGHYLGLRHIWGDGGCGADDFCDDTPESDGSNTGCPSTTSCGSTDMVENYMDYSDDPCMNVFTECQSGRMRFVMENSPRRVELLSSAACTPPTNPPGAAISADITDGCPGLVVQFSDNSTFNPDSWSWTFPGGSPASSTNENPVVTYTTVGSYNVTLTATNAFGNNTVTENAYITVSNNGTEVFWTEDFESFDFNTNGWSVDNPDNNNTWVVSTVAGNAPGDKAADIDNRNNNNVGQIDGLITPLLDFSQNSDIVLDFQHAHRRYASDRAETFRVYASIDGGTTFPFLLLEVAENGTGNFGTGAINAVNFVPAAVDDWCGSGTIGADCFTIDLSDYDGQTNVKLKFENENANGNHVYLDNIVLSGVCSATTLTDPPNPAFTANITEGCPGLTVEFTDNSNLLPTSWNWSFPGGTPSSSIAQNPSVTYPTNGSFDVVLTVGNANGTNTLTETAYVTIGNVSTDIFWSEDFENFDFNTNGWTIENPDGNTTWTVATVGGNNPGDQAAKMDNYNYNAEGQLDAIITPVIDFSVTTDITLDFEHAHRRYSEDYSDGFKVYLSTDGGATFPNVLLDVLDDATESFITGGFSNDFTPDAADDWCFSGTVGVNPCFSIDLSAYDGQSNVKLKFENINGYGNNTYIDNITLTGTCASVPPPNPTTMFVKAAVALEGAYDSNGQMNTELYSFGLVPLENPYGVAPWNYNGGESVATYADIPPKVVDWVLVEARDGNNPTQIIETHAAWLTSTGEIIDVTGDLNGVLFDNLISGNDYFIVVRHRNHLDIRSSQSVNMPSTSFYNFSNPANVESPSVSIPGVKEMVDGVSAMYAGDVTADGRILTDDFNAYLLESSDLNNYVQSDCNMNKVVTVADFNLYQKNVSITAIGDLSY